MTEKDNKKYVNVVKRHSYYIRPFVNIVIYLPENITIKEAENLSDMIKSIPYQDK